MPPSTYRGVTLSPVEQLRNIVLQNKSKSMETPIRLEWTGFPPKKKSLTLIYVDNIHYCGYQIDFLLKTQETEALVTIYVKVWVTGCHTAN